MQRLLPHKRWQDGKLLLALTVPWQRFHSPTNTGAYASSPLWSWVLVLHCCSSLGLVSCLGHPLLVPNCVCDASLGVISKYLFRELSAFRCFTFMFSLGCRLFPQFPGCRGQQVNLSCSVPFHGGGSTASEPWVSIAPPLSCPSSGVTEWRGGERTGEGEGEGEDWRGKSSNPV